MVTARAFRGDADDLPQIICPRYNLHSIFYVAC